MRLHRAARLAVDNTIICMKCQSFPGLKSRNKMFIFIFNQQLITIFFSKPHTHVQTVSFCWLHTTLWRCFCKLAGLALTQSVWQGDNCVLFFCR